MFQMPSAIAMPAATAVAAPSTQVVRERRCSGTTFERSSRAAPRMRSRSSGGGLTAPGA